MPTGWDIMSQQRFAGWPKRGEIVGGKDRAGGELGQVSSLPRCLEAAEEPEGRSRAKEVEGREGGQVDREEGRRGRGTGRARGAGTPEGLWGQQTCGLQREEGVHW